MSGNKNHEQEKVTDTETGKSKSTYLNEGMIFGPGIDCGIVVS